MIVCFLCLKCGPFIIFWRDIYYFFLHQNHIILPNCANVFNNNVCTVFLQTNERNLAPFYQTCTVLIITGFMNIHLWNQVTTTPPFIPRVWAMVGKRNCKIPSWSYIQYCMHVLWMLTFIFQKCFHSQDFKSQMCHSVINILTTLFSQQCLLFQKLRK